MTWATSNDRAEFETAAGEYLAADPAECTYLMGMAASSQERGRGAGFGWWRAGSGAAVGGAFICVPGRRAAVGPMPEAAARELALLWRENGPPAPLVVGPDEAVEPLVHAWRELGGGWRPARRERLFELTDLTAVAPQPPGRARLAGEPDAPLVARWFAEYTREVGEPAGGDLLEAALRRIKEGQITLWEADGEVVSLAGRSAVVSGQARVAPVYTPAGLRGHGYAGAVTFAVTEDARAAGAGQVILFTDTGNATSNALYQRLGFRPRSGFTAGGLEG
ncbi:GNAT family N-acetyltransferase [Streptomyces sp. NPDC056485]|uniref:GNAT family N-acetyltransferase n=1 Tax=Streptomyces sp. NPDC056485 TaxID=3345834 RepID=UPI0036BD5923